MIRRVEFATAFRAAVLAPGSEIGEIVFARKATHGWILAGRSGGESCREGPPPEIALLCCSERPERGTGCLLSQA
jgi:hypothetical protein